MFGLLAAVALLCQPVLSVESTLSFDSDGAKNRPVAKVVTLLKDMLKQMEKEGEEDEEIYNKMACWCETNDKEKTKSIADAEARIENLTTQIEELTALSAQLNTEIKNLEQEVAANQNALDKATAMRQKELAEFNGEEKDLLGSIGALKSAVTVLSKHNAASMLQVQTSQMQIVAAKVQHVMQKHADALKNVLTHRERRLVTSFLQAPQDSAPQSGEIFGILSQMKETFESNLANSQKEETTNQAAYEDLKAAKEQEIGAGQTMLDEKTQELADTDEKNAQSKEDLADTKNSLSSDEEFLSTLKEKCAATDSEWEARQKERALEMEACSKALAVLSGDDAHDLFSKTFGFVQTHSAAQSKRRTQASQVLAAAAKKAKNPRLSALSYRVKLDAFTKVKKAMDDMIGDLLAEKAAEIKHKDFCVEEFNTNQLETERKDATKSDLIAQIEDLTNTIKTLTAAIDTLKSEISEAQTQMKRAGEDREAQNKEFQMTVADQRATQKLLQKALSVLEGFYGKKAAALAQEQEGDAPPPPSFKAHKKNAASGGVMGMIQTIIDDAKALEAEAIRSEEDAQKSYEDFVKETNATIEAKTKDMINKVEEKGKTEASLVEAEKEKEATMLELEQLANYNAELHQSCDFVVKNFEIRQTARDEEVEAIKQAKAILSGAKFDSFLQN